MKKNRFLCFFILLTISVSAQFQGIVVDENDRPIPYVNIWVEGSTIGTSSEENGTFIIPIDNENRTLIFNLLGFEKKIILAKYSQKVVLKEAAIALNEVFISNKLETKSKEIGENKNSILEAFTNGPKVDCKFFPYLQEYKKTPYIKYVSLFTDSKIDDATIKIYFYSVGKDGLPDQNLLEKEKIILLKKGVFNKKFDVSEYHLIFPKTGIFVVFEKLMIEKNKLEKTTIDKNNNLTKTERLYFPFLLYNAVDRKYKFTFFGGKWIKEESQGKITLYEPAINIVLTN